MKVYSKFAIKFSKKGKKALYLTEDMFTSYMTGKHEF